MKRFLSRFGFPLVLLGVLLAGGWSWMGPSGVPALLEKWDTAKDGSQQIQELKRGNAEKQIDNQRLLGDPARQEEAIKEQMEVLGEGESKYVLPKENKSDQTPRPPQ